MTESINDMTTAKLTDVADHTQEHTAEHDVEHEIVHENASEDTPKSGDAPVSSSSRLQDGVTASGGKTCVVLASGGTGGHMFPARALATDLLSRGYRVVLCTDDRGMKYSDQWTDVERFQIASATFKKGIFGRVLALLALGRGFLQGRARLKALKPRVVVGFGGYPSLPTMVAAQRLHIPTIIHEQNAVMGKANAYLAPKADRIATSLPDITGLAEADSVRAVLTGNPVRSDVAALYTRPYPSMEPSGPFHVLVMGGSQGASVFASVVPAAMRLLPEALRRRVSIVQQCRTEEEIARARTAYRAMGVTARLETFIHDVAEQMDKSHLVISRSGASTVAEVTTAGRPAIFVPYPHHADQQQKINADAVAQSGGAWVMEEHLFTADTLKAKIETLMQRPEILFRAAESARSCARPDAGRKLGNLVTAMAYGWNKEDLRSYDYTQGHEG